MGSCLFKRATVIEAFIATVITINKFNRAVDKSCGKEFYTYAHIYIIKKIMYITCTCICICMYVCTQVYVHLCTYVHTYICTWMHYRKFLVASIWRLMLWMTSLLESHLSCPVHFLCSAQVSLIQNSPGLSLACPSIFTCCVLWPLGQTVRLHGMTFSSRIFFFISKDCSISPLLIVCSLVILGSLSELNSTVRILVSYFPLLDFNWTSLDCGMDSYSA